MEPVSFDVSSTIDIYVKLFEEERKDRRAYAASVMHDSVQKDEGERLKIEEDPQYKAIKEEVNSKQKALDSVNEKLVEAETGGDEKQKAKLNKQKIEIQKSLKHSNKLAKKYEKTLGRIEAKKRTYEIVHRSFVSDVEIWKELIRPPGLQRAETETEYKAA